VFEDWLIIVPARLGSSRLPRKPLQTLGGLPLIVRVYQNLASLKQAGATIIVACDDHAVADACTKHQIPTVMTDPDLPSGTDRCLAASKGFDQRFILNVQGDEPFIDLTDLKSLMLKASSTKAKITTMCHKSSNMGDYQNPNCVKVARNQEGYAVYFSRAPIPYARDFFTGQTAPSQFYFWHHLGVYAFTKESLSEFCKLPLSYLEQTEKLEQLRAIETGWRIEVAEASKPGFGIDTAEDLQKAEMFFSQSGLS
jgi:3-deoxy-manno-octulosonate cytidylyltransferase (CMP-KDO synthetase)